jgi:hypothetical protein
MIKTQFLVGGVTYSLEHDGKDLKETLAEAIVLANPHSKCICGNTGLATGFKFTSNKDKDGNTYVNLKCLKCGAKSKLGSYKTGGYFWHEFEVYKQNPTSSDNTDVVYPE